jgi:NADPH:quinone reductase-like Zn-dependent oxidoreductase
MPRAVRFDAYGGVDQLYVADVPTPTPGPGEALIRVMAAGTNPSEIAIREGKWHEFSPTSFPSGQGTDLAGVVTAVSADVTGVEIGDEVLGWSDSRSAQADYAVVPAKNLVPKPPLLPWEEAGALFIAGCTAWGAVGAADPQPGETVVVSGAAGGVGSLAVQLARRAGATVIGVAGLDNAGWLETVGVTPVAYGDGLADRIRAAAPNGVDAFVDTFGSGYVDLAIELGVEPKRIDTIADSGAAAQYGANAVGMSAAANTDVLRTMAGLVADGDVTMPIAATYPLADVREAYTALATRHTRGKIVLTVGSAH